MISLSLYGSAVMNIIQYNQVKININSKKTIDFTGKSVEQTGDGQGGVEKNIVSMHKLPLKICALGIKTKKFANLQQ